MAFVNEFVNGFLPPIDYIFSNINEIFKNFSQVYFDLLSVDNFIMKYNKFATLINVLDPSHTLTALSKNVSFLFSFTNL